MRDQPLHFGGQQLASTGQTGHDVPVATQNARIRQRLGAEIARVRNQLGMKTQPALAKEAALGLRTVVAVERGDKVSDRTMRQIENALHLPTGSTDDYADGIITELKPEVPNGTPDEEQDPRTEIDELRNLAGDYLAQAEKAQALARELTERIDKLGQASERRSGTVN